MADSDLYITIKYNEIRRLATFCGPISQMGWDLTSSGVLLTTTPDGLKAQTGSNDIFAFGTLPAEVHSHGQCLVLGTALADVIKALPLLADDEVEIATADDAIAIRSVDGKYHRTLFLIPTDLFVVPDIPDIEESFVVPPDTAEWLKRTSSAASTDPQRAPLNAIHISPSGMMATDSYKFIIVDFPWDELDHSVNVPVDLIKRIPDPSSYGDGQIMLGASEGKIMLSFGQLSLVSALVEGDYPDPDSIRNIIPTSHEYRFAIGVKDLKSALAAVSPLVGQLGGATIHPDQKIRVISRDLGMAEDSLAFLDEYTVPVAVTLPVGFLRESTSLLKDEEYLEFIFHPDKPDKFPVILLAAEGRVTVGCMPLANLD